MQPTAQLMEQACSSVPTVWSCSQQQALLLCTHVAHQVWNKYLQVLLSLLSQHVAFSIQRDSVLVNGLKTATLQHEINHYVTVLDHGRTVCIRFIELLNSQVIDVSQFRVFILRRMQSLWSTH